MQQRFFLILSVMRLTPLFSVAINVNWLPLFFYSADCLPYFCDDCCLLPAVTMLSPFPLWQHYLPSIPQWQHCLPSIPHDSIVCLPPVTTPFPFLPWQVQLFPFLLWQCCSLPSMTTLIIVSLPPVVTTLSPFHDATINFLPVAVRPIIRFLLWPH